MTAPLDEKARDAALAAWFANTAQGWHAAMEAAIRAYLAASPSPSEMEVVSFDGVAKRKLDGLLERGWKVSGYALHQDGDHGLITTGGFVGWFSVAERNDADARAKLEAAEAQVLRLTEENEGLIRQVSAYAYQRDCAREERDKAERRSENFWRPQKEAAEARIKALEDERDAKTAELRDKVALGATDAEILRFRDGYPNPAGGSKIFYRHSIEEARYRYADAVLAARALSSTESQSK